MTQKKSNTTRAPTAFDRFRTRRTEELKRDYPDQAGKDRQEQIREEWKESDENPKNQKD